VSTRELLLILGGLGVLTLLAYVFGIEYRSKAWYLLLVPVLAATIAVGFFVVREDRD
jgi:putative effector of murein hydrolase